MQNFEYHNPARIIFGKGRENDVGGFVKEYGTKALICYGGDYLKKNASRIR